MSRTCSDGPVSMRRRIMSIAAPEGLDILELGLMEDGAHRVRQGVVDDGDQRVALGIGRRCDEGADDAFEQRVDRRIDVDIRRDPRQPGEVGELGIRRGRAALGALATAARGLAPRAAAHRLHFSGGLGEGRGVVEALAQVDERLEHRQLAVERIGMEALQLAELDLDAVAAVADRQRELHAEPTQRVFERVELHRDHLAARQVVAGVEPAGGRAGAEVAEHGDADGPFGSPGGRRCIERSEVGGPVIVCHVFSLKDRTVQAARSFDFVDAEQRRPVLVGAGLDADRPAGEH